MSKARLGTQTPNMAVYPDAPRAGVPMQAMPCSARR